MSENNLTNPTPQFGTAEYAAQPGDNLCKSCNQAVTSNYYRINGVMACPNCAAQFKNQRPVDSHSAYTRGLLFGAGGALLGLVLYATFGIITGLAIGYVSLAVGYIVAKAMKMGSKGIGGRRYQIAAVLLTYAAVSMAAIPIGIAESAKQNKAPRPASVRGPRPVQTPASDAAPDSEQEKPTTKPTMNLGAALGGLLLLGLASPFLELTEPIHGVIGLVILFVGIRIAWRMTAETPINIAGPFKRPAPVAGQANAG
jgi:hypothetical protein